MLRKLKTIEEEEEIDRVERAKIFARKIPPYQIGFVLMVIVVLILLSPVGSSGRSKKRRRGKGNSV